MGRDIHVRVTKYNPEENIYRELKLYRTDIKTGELKEVYICSTRNYEMFEGMTNGDKIDGYGIFPSYPIALNSLEVSLKEDIKEKMTSIGYYDFSETTLSEMQYYTQIHPKVVDYSIENDDFSSFETAPKKKNPIIDLYEEICSFICFADNWEYDFTPNSYYKILFYFDC